MYKMNKEVLKIQLYGIKIWYFCSRYFRERKMSVAESDSAKIVQYLAKDVSLATQKTSEHQIHKLKDNDMKHLINKFLKNKENIMLCWVEWYHNE